MRIIGKAQQIIQWRDGYMDIQFSKEDVKVLDGQTYVLYRRKLYKAEVEGNKVRIKKRNFTIEGEIK